MAKKKPAVKTAPEALEAPVEALVEDVVADTAAEPIGYAWGYVVANDADTYRTIAARVNPGHVSNHEYALYLHALNGGKRISAGTQVKI